MEDTSTIPPSVAKDLKDHVHVKVDDSPLVDIAPYFDYVADKIQDIRKGGGRTLVHCGAGVSRSPTLVLAYLVKYEGMTLRAAFYHLSSVRAIAAPNIGFWRQLIAYEEQLSGQATVKLIPIEQRGILKNQVKKQDDYVSLVTPEKEEKMTPLEPDVYREKSKCQRNPRQWRSQTPQMKLKQKSMSPVSRMGSPVKSPSKRSWKADTLGHASAYSYGLLSEDWNGRWSPHGVQGHGYYQKYNVPIMKRHGSGGVFGSFASICDSMLPGL